jgi:hypothetical protein|tara:strand:+ start:303 stop:539 length:237 start_codon:yes stop_codon:yes gene_type:complete
MAKKAVENWLKGLSSKADVITKIESRWRCFMSRNMTNEEIVARIVTEMIDIEETIGMTIEEYFTTTKNNNDNGNKNNA